jgi:hypothetical protein
VSIIVVQWGKSLGKQSVLCTIITRKYTDHVTIIVHMDIYIIILLYTPVSFHFVLSFIRLLDLCRTNPRLVTFIAVVFLFFYVSCFLCYCVALCL